MTEGEGRPRIFEELDKQGESLGRQWGNLIHERSQQIKPDELVNNDSNNPYENTRMAPMYAFYRMMVEVNPQRDYFADLFTEEQLVRFGIQSTRALGQRKLLEILNTAANRDEQPGAQDPMISFRERIKSQFGLDLENQDHLSALHEVMGIFEAIKDRYESHPTLHDKPKLEQGEETCLHLMLIMTFDRKGFNRSLKHPEYASQQYEKLIDVESYDETVNATA